MNIQILDLGVVSTEADSKVKFIVLKDGRLLFGKVKWHKDLAAAVGLDDSIHVIGAGVIPEDLTTTDDAAWGGWKSTGYGVVTEESLREVIRQALQAK